MKLKSLFELFKNHKESRWIMQPYNTQLLYDFIKTYPVKKILDLGTGIGLSAAIIALAMKDKGETDYHIDSIEQFDKCVKIAKELIPQELQEHITIHHSPYKVWQTDKIPYQYFSTYETLPEGEWDLIIQDGPGGNLVNGHYLDLSNGTITKMLLEDKLKAGTLIVWDGRLKMLAILERYFSDNFQIVRPAQKGDDFNVIERLPNEVHFSDDKLKDMEVQNYFKDIKEITNRVFEEHKESFKNLAEHDK